MQTRQDIEILEDKILAPYAMKSKDAGPRLYQEPQHETRTSYQRDRDRIVHSEAFRKLEYKTQVFTIFEGDYYRTRLTHTIEVAQIGRTIGRNLRLNEDLIEAIALAHDLGHPPFAHAGEETLKDIMQKVGRTFDHNRRSFEIVTHMEKRYPHFDGLNLTREVLVGVLKHQSDYDMASFLKDYPEGPTLEARVVDFADSLAYLNHDVDDGLKSGCITVKDLEESTLWQRALSHIDPLHTNDNQEMLRYQVVKQLIDMQVRDLLSTTDKKLQELNFQSASDVKEYNQYYREKKTMGSVILQTFIKQKYHQDTIIRFSEKMKKERDFLQNLLYKKLYNHYRIVRMKSKARRLINDLFNAYVEHPQQLPYSVYAREQAYSKADTYEIICNYIASMTDRAALEEHKRLFNPYTKV